MKILCLIGIHDFGQDRCDVHAHRKWVCYDCGIDRCGDLIVTGWDRFLVAIGVYEEPAEEMRRRICGDIHEENLQKIEAGYTRTLDPGWSIRDLWPWGAAKH
jgi:hypothetical protein